MAAKRKRARAPGGQHRKGRPVSFYLWPESERQLHELADTLHMTRSAVVSLVIGQAYKREKLDARPKSA